MDVDLKVRPLHNLYEDLSGLPVELTLTRIWRWEAWLAKGWGEPELRLVIGHLKRRSVGAPVWAKKNMMFTKFVGDLELFEELLSEARAVARTPRFDPGKEQVLRATHRPARPEPNKEKTPDQIMRENNALRQLLELRDNL